MDNILDKNARKKIALPRDILLLNKFLPALSATFIQPVIINSYQFCFVFLLMPLFILTGILCTIYIIFLFRIVYNSIVFSFLWRPSGSKYLDLRSPLLFVSCFFVIVLDPFIFFIQNVQFLIESIKKFWMFARKAFMPKCSKLKAAN